MRILVITNRFPRPGHETDATYNGYQIDALARDSEVQAIVPVPWPQRLKDFGRGAGKQSLRGSVPVYHPTYWYLPRMAPSAYGQCFLGSIRRATEKVTKNFHPDVLLACWAHPDGWAAVRLGKELHLPVLIKVIGSDVLVLTRNVRRRAKIAEALREADGVLAVSQHLADHVRQLGVDPQRIHVVPEGTNSELFGPGDQIQAASRLGQAPLATGTSRLLYVGNLLKSKGVGVLIEACALLRQRGIAFRCHIVGHGQDERSLRALARQHNLGPEWVDFVGSYPQGQLADWYRMSDLVLLASFSEGIPNVLREAMMCGRRFVATRVGGIPEITKPGVGWLVEKGNAGQLAEAVISALASGSTRNAESGVLSASGEVNITWRQSAQAMLTIMQDAIARKGAHRPDSTGRQKHTNVPTDF